MATDEPTGDVEKTVINHESPVNNNLEQASDSQEIRQASSKQLEQARTNNPDQWSGSFTGAYNDKLPALPPDATLEQAHKLEKLLNANALIIDNHDGTYVTAGGVIDIAQNQDKPNEKTEQRISDQTQTDSRLFLLYAAKDVGADIEDYSGQMVGVGSSLLAASNRVINEQKDRAIGASIGIVQGAGDLSIGVMTLLEFAGDVLLGQKEQAEKKGAKFGESVGKTLVSGVNIFQLADDYLYDIGYHGDYSKPFRDISSVGRALDKAWRALPPLEQERLKFRLATNIAGAALPLAGATRVTKAESLTSAIEEAAVLAKEVDLNGNTAARAIGKFVDDAIMTDSTIDSKLAPNELTEIKQLEKRLAGGVCHNFKYFDETPAPDMVRQLTPDSCVSAVGEFLSKGRLTQRELIKLIDSPSDPKFLAQHLGENWECGWVAPHFDRLMAKHSPWSADFFHRRWVRYLTW